MRRLPRPNEEIFDTDVIWTPDKMPQAIDAAFTEIEDNSGGIGDSISADVDGVGRLVGLDYLTTDATAPRASSPAALAVELPNSIWYVENRRIVIDETTGALVIGGVPANKPNGVYGYANAVEIGTSSEYTLQITAARWSETLREDWTADGLACIGLVKTDSEKVIKIVADAADVVIPNRVFKKWLRVLDAQPIGGDSGGSGGGTVGDFTNLQNRLAALEAALPALEAALRAEILAGGRRPMTTHLDQVTHDVAIAWQASIKLNPGDGERGSSANIVRTVEGIYGVGTNFHPTHLGATDLTLNDNGEFEP